MYCSTVLGHHVLALLNKDAGGEAHDVVRGWQPGRELDTGPLDLFSAVLQAWWQRLLLLLLFQVAFATAALDLLQ